MLCLVIYECVCVYVDVYMYTYVYMHMCVSVCRCIYVYMRARLRAEPWPSTLERETAPPGTAGFRELEWRKFPSLGNKRQRNLEYTNKS